MPFAEKVTGEIGMHLPAKVLEAELPNPFATTMIALHLNDALAQSSLFNPAHRFGITAADFPNDMLFGNSFSFHRNFQMIR